MYEIKRKNSFFHSRCFQKLIQRKTFEEKRDVYISLLEYRHGNYLIFFEYSYTLQKKVTHN